MKEVLPEGAILLQYTLVTNRGQRFTVKLKLTLLLQFTVIPHPASYSPEHPASWSSLSDWWCRVLVVPPQVELNILVNPLVSLLMHLP